MATVLSAACGSSAPVIPDPDPPPDTTPTPDPDPDPIPVPALGTDTTLDIVTWNILFFGAANQGPTDEILQRARARDVILGTDADVWAVQEIVVASAFEELVARLPGYSGLLVTDTEVTDGTNYYRADELKVGIIYKTEVLEPLASRVILTGFDYEFAGRPPLEVQARVTVGGSAATEIVIVVLHAKASTDAESWERRAGAAAGLKDHLDDSWPDAFVIVPGDWNDDLDESITAGRDTPYRLFLEAAPTWDFPTAELGAGGATSILGYDDVIDHILTSDEAMALYEDGSAVIVGVNEHIPDYRNTTSDHLPVLVRLRPPGG